MLELLDPTMRLQQLSILLAKELELLELEDKIHIRVQHEVDKGQREFFLREQMKIIQSELGEGDPHTQELNELREQATDLQLPEEAQLRVDRELTRLAAMPPMSPEVSILRTYLDWLTTLPWHESTEDNLDIKMAKKVLDDDHYGLKKPKQRVIEYLAVRKLKPESKGPILCFAGPPGTGKTSLGNSIARALGRKFVRISLGGVRDEAEIRGHRRTYVGALPGRIIQGIRRSGSNNPVFMLDEIDKVGSDFRGDPSSALLEVLDPEQNFSFSDHYLDVPFDLSNVLFVCTANQLETIDHVLMFSGPLPGPADTLDALADPADASAPLDDRARAADLGLTPLLRCARITLGVLSDLNAVGLIAAVSKRLAQAQIPVNVFSAIHHDHLFVPPQQASRALELLREMASAGTPT